MATRFLGEGNIGNIDMRSIANGNHPPRVVISLNTHFDNLVRNKQTDELEDQGGFWAPVEFWPQTDKIAQHLVTNVFKKGMRIRVDGNLVNETFADKDTGEQRSIMKVRTFQSGISICLQRLTSTSLAEPKRAQPSNEQNQPNEQSQSTQNDMPLNQSAFPEDDIPY